WRFATESRPRGWWQRVAVNAPARLVARYDTIAEVFRLDDGAPVTTLRSTGAVSAAAFDRTGTRLATGDVTGEIRVFALPDGAQIASCAGHTDRIAQLAF